MMTKPGVYFPQKRTFGPKRSIRYSYGANVLKELCGRVPCDERPTSIYMHGLCVIFRKSSRLLITIVHTQTTKWSNLRHELARFPCMQRHGRWEYTGVLFSSLGQLGKFPTEYHVNLFNLNAEMAIPDASQG